MATFTFLGTSVTCHSSWDNFFNDPIIQGHLLKMDQQITNMTLQNKTKYTPHKSDIFKVFKMDLAQCKVVILGQDPYPQQNVATGRAFEENGISSWKNVNQASLQSILKLLHMNQCNTIDPSSIDDVRNDIGINFNISSPDRLFNNWENNGVLLLNTALTCEQGTTQSASGSHLIIWSCFIQKVICFIQTHDDINWFLWGLEAQEFEKIITNSSHTVHKSNHPASRGPAADDFYTKNHFKQVAINWY